MQASILVLIACHVIVWVRFASFVDMYVCREIILVADLLVPDTIHPRWWCSVAQSFIKVCPFSHPWDWAMSCTKALLKISKLRLSLSII